MKKAQATGKIVREMMVAAKMGGADPASNARLAAAVEKARKESVSREVIERAIKKGAGTGDEKLVMEHVVFEGYAPHKVPVIVEVYTDNVNRSATSAGAAQSGSGHTTIQSMSPPHAALAAPAEWIPVWCGSPVAADAR